MPSRSVSDVVFVLLTLQTRLLLPPGEKLAELDAGQMVTVTGTMNWRTPTVLLPTSLSAGAAEAPTPCDVLPAAGERTCPGTRPTPVF